MDPLLDRLRAPLGDGETLEIPSLAKLPGVVAENRRRIASQSFSIGGRPVDQLRASARADLLRLARNYSSQYRDASVDTEGTETIVVSGHQPELYHPGVWYKNFCLDRIARDVDGTGVNLITDNDLCLRKSITVPVARRPVPRTRYLKFDTGGLTIPYEMQQLDDQELFQGFGALVGKAIRKLIATPAMERYWPLVLDANKTIDNPCLAIAAGRHRLEHEWGLVTLELPLGRACDTGSFGAFVAELLERHREFREIHNESLDEFRTIHSIRGPAQPVPRLGAREEWTETPFWVWSRGNPVRRALWVRYLGDSLVLSDLDSLHREFSSKELAECPLVLSGEGVCLRPRALTTTMYCRLVLCDLFLHGIGGGKYDSLTDRIMERLFEISAPAFAVATATLRLPLEIPETQPVDLTAVRARLRELRFHPETMVEQDDDGARELVAKKSELIRSAPNGSGKKAWHLEIEQVNQSLQPLVEGTRRRLLEEEQQVLRHLEENKVLASREFAWCLFPDELAKRLSKSAWS